MGSVGGEGKLVTFAKKRPDFKFYLSGSWERDSDIVNSKEAWPSNKTWKQELLAYFTKLEMKRPVSLCDIQAHKLEQVTQLFSGHFLPLKRKRFVYAP